MAALILAGGALADIEVYQEPQEALAEVFGTPFLIKEEFRPSPQARRRMEELLGWALPEPVYEIYRTTPPRAPPTASGEKRSESSRGSGYAMVMNEIGKTEPITFLVKTDENLKVEEVRVLIYREPVGAEVRRKRFRNQLRGKTLEDPIRINRDIRHITGATLSSIALAAGTKKALAVLSEWKRSRGE